MAEDHGSSAAPIPGQLVARLEAASAGSRELDCLIHEWQRPEYTPAMRGMYYGEATGEYFCDDGVFAAPAYTTSLDAALALAERALPGSVAVLNTHDRSVLFALSPVHMAAKTTKAATLPLALCIAVLKATTASARGYEAAEQRSAPNPPQSAGE